jgi:hypothetical protein
MSCCTKPLHDGPNADVRDLKREAIVTSYTHVRKMSKERKIDKTWWGNFVC